VAPPDSAGPTDHPLVHALAGRDHMDALAQFLQSARAEPSAVAREPRVDKGPQSRVQPGQSRIFLLGFAAAVPLWYARNGVTVARILSPPPVCPDGRRPEPLRGRVELRLEPLAPPRSARRVH
jgi:hypothetical protein